MTTAIVNGEHARGLVRIHLYVGNRARRIWIVLNWSVRSQVMDWDVYRDVRAVSSVQGAESAVRVIKTRPSQFVFQIVGSLGVLGNLDVTRIRVGANRRNSHVPLTVR